MLMEDIVFEIIVRFYQGDEDDKSFWDFQERVKKNFQNAKIVSPGSAEAKIISVEMKNKEI